VSTGNITPILRDASSFFSWTTCAFCMHDAWNSRELSVGEGLEIRASVFALSTLYVEPCRWDRENDTTKTSAGRCDRKCLELASRAHDCTTRRRVWPRAFQIGQLLYQDWLKFGRADRGSCMALTGEVAGGRRERGRHACFEFACLRSECRASSTLALCRAHT
jgi:hypothetical protein